jgi:hypothetical protein
MAVPLCRKRSREGIERGCEGRSKEGEEERRVRY